MVRVRVRLRTLIRLCFVISDAAAWLVVIGGLFAALTFLIVAPIEASHQRLIGEQPASYLVLVVTVAIPLLSAAGAYLLARRKPQGLFIMAIAWLLWLGSSQIFAALIYGGLVLAFFGLPLLLSYLEARSSTRGV